MAVIETWFEQDLQKPVKVRYIDGNLFSHNGNGNRIGVVVTNNGEAVTLTGTVSGYAVLSDGTTVPCTGTRSGNKASILVPAAAYSPGRILISIFLTDGTTVTTLAALSSSVIMARTGNQIDPGSVVTDWTNTINAAMQSVETAASNLGNIVATPYANLTFPVPLGKYTIYNNGLYRCISPIASSEAWTAAHWTNVKLGDEVTELKSALNAEYALDRKENGVRKIGSSAFVHGGIQNALNFPLVLTDVTSRARPCGFIKVNKGDRFIVKPGSYKFAVYMWTGDPYSGANVLNRNWATTEYERSITTETFALVAYADATDATATINLANFDGSIEIIPYEQDQIAETNADLTAFESLTNSGFENINAYDNAQLTGWVQGAAYKETGGDKIVTNTVLTRCNLMMTRIDDNIQRIYSKSGYQFNVFACTIDENSVYHVVTGSYATWQTSVDVSDYSDEYYLVIYVSKTNTSSNILPSEAQENILYVSKFGKRITNDIESRQHNPYGLKNPLICPASPRITMHRGFMGQAPENTVPAFLLAGQGGAWGIETDVWETTDGYFILNHNNDVSGMTDGTGNITSMTYAQVQACTVDSGVNINLYPNLKLATIDEYMQICRRYGCVACIEIKGITHYDNFINKILKYGMEGSIIIFIGWDESKVGTLRGITDIPIVILGDSNFSTLLSNTEKFTDLWLGVDKTLISESNLNQAHLKNVPVVAWAYLNQSDIEDAVAMGLDIAIANNNPTID